MDEEITEETKEKLPAELYGILMRWMVESGKKNKKPRNEKTKKIQTPVCEGVAGIL